IGKTKDFPCLPTGSSPHDFFCALFLTPPPGPSKTPPSALPRPQTYFSTRTGQDPPASPSASILPGLPPLPKEASADHTFQNTPRRLRFPGNLPPDGPERLLPPAPS